MTKALKKMAIIGHNKIQVTAQGSNLYKPEDLEIKFHFIH